MQAPELFDEKREINEKIDIYALGVLLVELWSGQRPFEGQSLFDIVRVVGVEKTHPPIPLTVPEEVGTLAKACMSWEAAQRPTCAQVLKRLMAIEEELKASAAKPDEFAVCCELQHTYLF